MSRLTPEGRGMKRDRFDHSDITSAGRPRRVEVLTGPERRRRWSAAEKQAIIAESLAVGAVVSAVARCHGISPQQLFGWRAKARSGAAANTLPEPAAFAPVVVEPVPAAPASGPTGTPEAPSIDIRLGGASVCVRGAVDSRMLAAVLKALRVLA